jgi:hypothetical protein
MQKCVKSLVVIALIISGLTFSSRAYSVIDLNSLIEDALEYNGQTVTVEGEAIGEALKRGEYSWVNINDGSNAIGIWLKTEDAEKIAYFGGYKSKGDTIRITGTFSRDCPEHGGDVDIHCSSFEVIKKGGALKEDLSKEKIYLAIVLFLTAACAFLLYSINQKKTKNK